jgi:hypothetical protein
MKNQKILAALKIINEKLKSRKIRWVLAGTTGLALQGVEISPNDIDILTDKEGALKINELLKEYEVKPVKFRRSKIFESYFGKFKISNVEVDVIGNLRVKLSNRWKSVELLSNTVEMDGTKIRVYPIREALKAYRIMKRKKDFVRIRMIEKALKN